MCLIPNGLVLFLPKYMKEGSDPRGCENRERWGRRALFLEDEALHPRWSSRGRHPDREFVP